ncbi:unnamed protein product, partial [Meganyctiphanes norvegica]
GHFSIVEALIEAHADVSISDNDGDTALHKAAWNDNMEIARLLLRNGLDPTLQDIKGKTPGDIARKLNFNQLVDMIDGFTGIALSSTIAPTGHKLNNFIIIGAVASFVIVVVFILAVVFYLKKKKRYFQQADLSMAKRHDSENSLY